MPLPLHVNSKRGWDYNKEEFIEIEEHDVVLEHCLLAIARWESKWKKSFFESQLSRTEWYDYIRCMALDVEEPEHFASSLSDVQILKIFNYIKESQTAAWFNDTSNPPRDSTVTTTDLVYYYMAQVPLPFEICERWHLSRLLAILKIASIKSQPDKKMSEQQILAQNRDLNRQRHEQLAKMKASMNGSTPKMPNIKR